MTDQQERMAKEILTTMRSIQNTSHTELISILSRLTDETFQSGGKYRVMLNSYRDISGNGKKIQAIKVLREHTALGLKEAKEILDQLDRSDMSIVFVTGVDHDAAIAIVNDLREIGLSGRIEKN